MRLWVRYSLYLNIYFTQEFLQYYSVGYSLLLDGRTCVDVDECHENTRICNGGRCVNTQGSYSCVCVDGLSPGPGGISCLGTS